MKASISKIETFSTVDGPGIRTTIFLNGCSLRCKFCHNPETWLKKEENKTTEEIIKGIERSKPYFKNNGGVTFSGGEPLLHQEFLIDICKRLKEENIHIALDTAGVGKGNYKELLKYVDLVLLDIKGITKEGFQNITGKDQIEKVEDFIKQLNESKKEVWIRQVIIPGVNDNLEYMDQLLEYLKKIQNIKKIELLPFHTMAFEKYEKENIPNPYKNIEAMDKAKCQELENYLNKKREEQ